MNAVALLKAFRKLRYKKKTIYNKHKASRTEPNRNEPKQIRKIKWYQVLPWFNDLYYYFMCSKFLRESNRICIWYIYSYLYICCLFLSAFCCKIAFVRVIWIFWTRSSAGWLAAAKHYITFKLIKLYALNTDTDAITIIMKANQRITQHLQREDRSTNARYQMFNETRKKQKKCVLLWICVCHFAT